MAILAQGAPCAGKPWVFLRNIHPRESGFNLIEAAIVLGIDGLIVGGIWAAAGAAYENMRQQNASKQLLSLVQGLRGFYAESPVDRIDANITNLIGLGVLPSDMLVETGGAKTLRHPWGGAVTLTDTTTAYGIASFKVTFEAMKSDVCRNFLTRASNLARGSGLLLVDSGAGGAGGSGDVLNLIADSNALNTAITCTDQAAPFFVFSLRG
jgi:PilS N terminal